MSDCSRSFEDPEAKLHVDEFKIRLRPSDGALVRALAGKLDIPPAVLLRRWAVSHLGPLGSSVPAERENGRAA